MNKVLKNLTFYVLILLVLFTAFGRLVKQNPIKDLSYSEFLDKVEQKAVSEVLVLDRQINGTLKDKTPFTTYYPAEDKNLIQIMRQNAINIKINPPTALPWYLEVLLNWLPIIVFIGFWIYILQKTNGGGSRAMSFGKMKTKPLSENKLRETFKDVAGCDEAKEELADIVEFLKNPPKFQRLGGRIPKGVLLVGPPGTGKTLLSRAVAGEAEVPFFNISGSDFVEMFVGVGASRVRDLFYQGKKSAPCIIFIDEIDAVGRQRGTGLGGGHDEREQTLNQLLVEMDGFETNEGIILIAATNRPDVLDPALLRPGRFDREITVDYPDLKGRIEILNVHTKKIPAGPDVNVELIARGTPGLAGADLANIVNEAALIAAKLNKPKVEMIDFEQAKDKILMGAERKSRVISDDEKKITAYHEAGHTLVIAKLPESDPVHKVSIIPRGRSLGVTHSLPERDRYHYSKQHFVNRITGLMGGRVAEEIIFNQIYTGASHDMQVATGIAHNMVCAWGMSDKLGPITYGKREEHVFLGRELSKVKDYSEETAKLIDEEVAAIITNCHNQAQQLIRDNINALHDLAKALLEFETIDAAQVADIISGKKIAAEAGTVNEPSPAV
ncbi:MAG: ATP-dependent zinc metalloprotease FtsH [Candidatus Wallbacteria bacterium]